MSGAEATAWVQTLSPHRYSTFMPNVGPEYVICGRCGASVLNGIITDQSGQRTDGVVVHDQWHNHITNMAQQEAMSSLAMRLQSYLEPGMRIVAEKAVADRTSDILEMTRAIKDFVDDAKAELQAMLSEPIEHEPSTTIPGVRRAQPDFTVLKES